MIAPKNRLPEPLTLSVGRLPSYEELDESLRRAHGDTLLTKPLFNRYLSLFQLMPLADHILELTEIAEAAAAGDERAIALELALARREAETLGFETDAVPFPDKPEDRTAAVKHYVKRDDILAKDTAPIADPYITVGMLDESIRVLAGEIVVASMPSLE